LPPVLRNAKFVKNEYNFKVSTCYENEDPCGGTLPHYTQEIGIVPMVTPEMFGFKMPSYGANLQTVAAMKLNEITVPFVPCLSLAMIVGQPVMSGPP